MQLDWIKPTAQTWVQLLSERASTQPNDIAMRFLVDGENEIETLTYKELHDKASAIASTLQSLAEPGERAVILLPNNLSFVTTFFGCLYAGLIAVPGYPPRANRNKDRITKVLKQCGGRVIIGDSNLDRNELMLNLANLGFRGVRYFDYATSAATAPSGWVAPAVQPSDIAFLQYTSGSTNDPKGVCLTHENLIANMVMVQKSFGLGSHTKLVSWLPLYHDMGLIGGVLLAVYIGFTFTFMAPATFIQKPRRWLKALAKYKATMAGGPNFTFDLCVSRYDAAELEGLDLSSLETFFNGAEPIRPSSLDAFTRAYSSHGIKPSMYFPCYGLAEGSVFVTGGPKSSGAAIQKISKSALQTGQALTSGDDLIALAGSGRVAEGLDLRIVDPDSLLELEDNRVGEIWVSGPSVSAGYWNNEEQNRQTFGQRLTGSQGNFLRTGDLGYLSGGELFVTGRIKDVLIISGRNHYPQDLELTAQTRSPVASIAATFTIDDNERLAMVVEVGRSGMRADLAEEAQKIVQAVGSEHELVLTRVAFVRPGDLPRTSSGKVQRQLTRRKLLDGSLELVHDWSMTLEPSATASQKKEAVNQRVEQVVVLTPTVPADLSRLEEVRAFMRARVKELKPANAARVSDTVPLSSVGIDSIAAVELVVSLDEAFNVQLPETLVWDHPTIERASEFVLDAIQRK